MILIVVHAGLNWWHAACVWCSRIRAAVSHGRLLRNARSIILVTLYCFRDLSVIGATPYGGIELVGKV
jgi:hypothetical protein